MDTEKSGRHFRSNISENAVPHAETTNSPHTPLQAEQLQSSVSELTTRESMDLLNTSYDYSLQQQVLQLQHQNYSMQTEMNSLRNRVQWLYDNMQMRPVQQPLAAVQKEYPVQLEQQEPSAMSTAADGETFNGFTKDQLRACITQNEYAKAAKMLLRRLFGQEEIIGKSLTGAARNKATAPKPAVDQRKLSVIHELIREKWHFVTKAMVNNKLADLLKPSCNSPMAGTKNIQTKMDTSR